MKITRRSLLLLAVVAVVTFLLVRRQKREFAGNKLKVLKFVNENPEADGFAVIAELEAEGFSVEPPQMEKILELAKQPKKKALADFILAM